MTQCSNKLEKTKQIQKEHRSTGDSPFAGIADAIRAHGKSIEAAGSNIAESCRLMGYGFSLAGFAAGVSGLTYTLKTFVQLYRKLRK